MKIESGKYYRTRDGRKVGQVKHYEGEYYEGRLPCGQGCLWNQNGRRYGKSFSDTDLIAEWTELTPHQARTAEMIKAMQAYVGGAEIESRLKLCGYKGWSNISLFGEPTWNWSASDYRIAPSTTPDTLDWSHVAPEFKWMARDADDRAFVYENEPSPDSFRFTVNKGEFQQIDGLLASYKRGTCDWRDSLVKRP